MKNDKKHFCEYGCGQEATYQFKNGKWCCSHNIQKCKASRNKVSIKTLESVKRGKNKWIKKLKPEICEYGCGQEAKYYIKSSNKWCCSKSQNSCPYLKQINREINKSKECREKVKNTCFKNFGFYNPSKSPDFKSKFEARCLIKYNVTNPSKLPEVKQNKKNTCLKNFGVDNPSKSIEVLKKIIENRKPYFPSNEPNKPENNLLYIFKELKLDYRYTGNGYTWIGGKNPDFVNFKTKKIVEHFGTYYHGVYFRQNYFKDFSSNEEHELERINHFKKYNFKTLIIWENELCNIPKLIEKILKFDKT